MAKAANPRNQFQHGPTVLAQRRSIFKFFDIASIIAIVSLLCAGVYRIYTYNAQLELIQKECEAIEVRINKERAMRVTYFTNQFLPKYHNNLHLDSVLAYNTELDSLVYVLPNNLKDPIK